jgi:hypothetical protein
MHKATPGAHRTLRTIAEEKNGRPGFEGPDDQNYDAQGGHPKMAGQPQGEYRDAGDVAPVNKPSGEKLKPFSTKGA